MEKEVLRVFSAFAGYGTDNFALKRLGIPFECVGFSEIDKYAIQCFIQNHAIIKDNNGTFTKITPRNYGDITLIDWNKVPDFDLLTGGFPCTDVSVAGKQDLSKGRSILGFELTKALKIKQPKWFMFENVRGILSKKFKSFLEELERQWEDAGYCIYTMEMNTRDYGIPQNRQRVFFIGFRKDLDHTFVIPEKEELKIFIKDILEPEPVDSKYYLKSHQVEKLVNAIQKKLAKKQILDKVNTNGHQSGEVNNANGVMRTLNAVDYKEPPKIFSIQFDISGKGYNSQQDRAYDANGVMCCIPNANPSNKVNIFQLNGDRANLGISIKEDVANTIPANPMSDRNQAVLIESKDRLMIVNGREGQANRVYDIEGVSPSINVGWSPKIYSSIFRRLTPKECFRLQGFVNDEINLEGLSDTQKYKLAGNGQSVNVVAKIFERMFHNSLPAKPKSESQKEGLCLCEQSSVGLGNEVIILIPQSISEITVTP